jgi:hypothetical protein
VNLPPLEPMPEDVQTLLENLHNREGPPAAAKELVRSRLEQTLSLDWSSSAPHQVGPPALRAPWSAGRMLLAVVGVVGIGGGLLWSAGRIRQRPPQADRVATPPPAPAPAALEAPGTGTLPSSGTILAPAVVAPANIEAHPLERLRPTRRVGSPINGVVAGTPVGIGLAGERQLLDQARNALRDGDARRALSAVGEHERRYPEGQLAEEREVLAIEAMVRSGSYPEARARAQAFQSRFPQSPLHRVVQSTVDSIP